MCRGSILGLIRKGVKSSHGHAAVWEESYFIHVTGKLGRQNTAETPESEDLPCTDDLHMVTNDGQV